MSIFQKVVKYSDIIALAGMSFGFLEMLFFEHTDSFRIIYTIIYVLYVVVVVVKLIRERKNDAQ